MVGGFSEEPRSVYGSTFTTRMRVISRDIVRSCVSGLREWCLPVGSVPATSPGRLVVLRDDRAVCLGEYDGDGVPRDADLFTLAFISGVELVGEDPDVSALGYGPCRGARDPS